MAVNTRLLSTRQVAEMLGRSVSWVQLAAKSGRIPALKLGPGTAGYVFDAELVAALAAEREASKNDTAVAS